MSLGPCPGCGNQVSLDAAFCPRCGNTKFLVDVGIEKLSPCTAVYTGQWETVIHCDGFGESDCYSCKGRGVVAKPYQKDVRDGVTVEEHRARVERENEEALAEVKRKREAAAALTKEYAEKREREAEEKKRQEDEIQRRRQNGLCLDCGKPLGIAGWFKNRHRRCP